MSLSQDSNGAWIDDPASGFGGQRLNDNFTEIFKRAPKVNFTAIIPPTINNDSSQGYTRNSIWIDISAGIAYRCINPSVGAAVWVGVANHNTLVNHVANTANPHSTTAAQVGAVTTGNFNTAIAALYTHLYAIRDEDNEILFGKGLDLQSHDFVTPVKLRFQNPDDGVYKWRLEVAESFYIVNSVNGNDVHVSSDGTTFVATKFSGDGSLLTHLTAANIDGLGTAASKNTGTSAGQVPLLDGSGYLPSTVFPPLAITEITVVASQAAMLALTAQKGDIAVRTDLTPNRTFMLTGVDSTNLSNWTEIQAAGGVSTVNGYSGTVALTYSDVHALSDNAPSWSGTASGNGSSITAINGSNISTGTVANARTTATSVAAANTIVARDNSGDFGAHTVTLTGNLSAANLSGDGSGITNIAGSNIPSLVETIGINLKAIASTGQKAFRPVGFAGTLVGYTIVANTSGSCVFDIKRATYAGYPTSASIATATLSASAKAVDNTLNVALAADDVIFFNLTSYSTISEVTIILRIKL